MAEYVNFGAVEENIDDDVIDVDESEEMHENVCYGDFMDDENVFDENIEDYYAFKNVSRSAKDAMQDSSIDFDYSQQAKNY